MLDLKALLTKLTQCANTRYLLWTNPTSTSGMASNTTVSLDLSDYDLVEIIFWKSSNAGRRYECSNVSSVPSSGALSTFEITNGSATTMLLRTYTVTTTGITFSAGYWRGAGDTVTHSANDPAMPIKIYGIKLSKTGGGS